jgi:diaminohydroxyphosphoribosylaminopyrimidine deaminase/5-amino-6-(5-phosphoribosylamino)uracil reductase
MSADTDSWMRRALELAEFGRGHVEPNPLVGAVLVRDDKIVGASWHAKFGGPHAEINALAEAGADARGATLYVTLEPCCHHGKTPPCTDAVIAAGVARVVSAMEDPFPQVAGQGAARLCAAGIPVEFGLLAPEARRQNAPYLKLLTTGLPFVHAKWAMSLDGKIATLTGDSKWISNEASRRRVHELRGRMDGILIGVGTALADDPLLTARPAGPRMPCRVILDSQARLPATSQLVQTAREAPTLVVVGEGVASGQLTKAGCEVLALPWAGDGRPDIRALLQELGRRRWTNLLVEGGAGVLGSFFDANLVDEIHAFIAPKILGGAGAKSPVAGIGLSSVALGGHWSIHSNESLDGDVYVRACRGV